MEPNSITLLVTLLLGAASLLVLTVRGRALVFKILTGVLAMALSLTAGIALVNDYYGYYQTWSQMSADLTGSYSATATTTVKRRFAAIGTGQLRSIELAGARSGIDRRGLLYLPPQYFEQRYAHTRFPVVELIHGTPGSPSAWVVHLGVVRMLDHLIKDHFIGPMIAVMPQMSVGHDFEECVNSPTTLDDTYITHDVRQDVISRYRASAAPAEWGIAGYSSGGYCAANLSLRHPADFGAAGIMDGYFRPTDGPAAAALDDNRAAEAANDPLLEAGRLTANARPLPSWWVSAGTGDAADMAAARAFGRALHGVETMTLYREPGASHNFYAWIAAMPHLLAWMWPHLAPPSLRVQFPIAGKVQNASIRLAQPAPSRCAAPN